MISTESRLRWRITVASVFAAFLLVVAACSDDNTSGAGLDIAAERGFTQEQIDAALTTYMPSGEIDPYIMFASTGQAGQVAVLGVPSMRLLKIIGVFTPEPWQGWGYGAEGTMEILEGGQVDGRDLRWGDTHHVALSETGGDYDGQFLFVNDKANARVAVIDLRDFETKQIIKNPVAINDHGGAKVTPRHRVGRRGRPVRHPSRLGVRPDRGLPDRLSRHGDVLEVRPCRGPDRRGRLLRHGAAALLAGSL